MTEQQHKTCSDIIEHYGVENQREILVEECAELIQAVSKCKRNGTVISDNLVEELADVSIMLEQILTVLSKTERERYDRYITTKLNRQISRINGLPERGCTDCKLVKICSTHSGYCGKYIPNVEV